MAEAGSASAAALSEMPRLPGVLVPALVVSSHGAAGITPTE